jgi:ABC-type Zn uptake system ZnuABC Zn-binding protein ZnuA
MIENADVVVLSGAGLEFFLEDALSNCNNFIDASVDVHTHSGAHHHEHSDHSHENDPHIWLSPANASVMATNICKSLCALYPLYEEVFTKNLDSLLQALDDLQRYGQTQLSNLSYAELITFHDGFGYLAESFDLTILEAVEEESGSEASAMEIIHLIELVNSNGLPAIFTETNGSDACASIISTETGANVYALDMAITGESYFNAMYYNIDTIKEALK